MADKRDYYEVLGVDKGADDAALKQAYRSLAKKYHPDLHPGDAEAEQKFKEINEAYGVLSDSEKRAQYDRFGHAAFDASAGGGGGYSGFGGGFDFGDIFSSFFGGGGGGRRRADAPVEGDDVGVRVILSFEEAVFGCKKEISYNRIEECPDCHATGAAPGTSPETCPNCRGTGRVTIQQRTFMGVMQSETSCQNCRGTGKVVKTPCSNCKGKGFIRLTKKLSVTIPEGIDNGQRVLLRGQGSAGRNGGRAGDLIIEVSVRPHPIFEREGNSVFCDIPISISEATLGAEIDIPMLNGKTKKYSIPEGTQPGTSFTMRGEGVADVNSKRKGNLVFTVVVEIPRNLNSEQKKLLREFGETLGDKNDAKQSGFRKKIRDLFGGKK